MPSRQVLESHPLSHLKKEISQTNIKGYSKLKKDGIIDLMLKHKDRFHHIQMYKLPERVKKEKPKSEPKAEPKKKVIKKKVVIKDKPFSADCSNAIIQAEKIIRFYTKNKGIFSKEKFLIKNKVDLQNKVDTIKKILIDPKCKDIETDPPFRPLLEKSLALHLENKDKKPKEVEGVITLKEFIEEYKESQENGDLPPKKLTDKEFKEAYEKFLKRPENKPKAKKVEPKAKPKKEEKKKKEKDEEEYNKLIEEGKDIVEKTKKLTKIIEDNKTLLESDKFGKGAAFRNSYEFYKNRINVNTSLNSDNEKIKIVNRRIKELKAEPKKKKGISPELKKLLKKISININTGNKEANDKLTQDYFKNKEKKAEPKKKKIIKKKPEPKEYKVNSLTFDGTNMKDFDEFFRKNF